MTCPARTHRSQRARWLVLLLTLCWSAAALAVPSIPNPSAELASPDDPNQPAGWEAGAWGGITTFDHTWTATGAYDGKRALRVSVGKVGGEGDARWISELFDIAAADADGTFALSVHYRSNVEGFVVAQAVNADGSKKQWLSIGAAPVSAAWGVFAANVKLPSWAAKLRVALVISANGWVETDAWSFGEALPPPKVELPDPALDAVSPLDGNVLPNPSFELASDNDPQSPRWWRYGEWGGAGSSNGTWMVGNPTDGTAYDGGRYVRLLQAKVAAEGDAKWTSDYVPLSALGDTLRLTCHYRGAPLGLLVHAVSADGKQEKWTTVAHGPQWKDWRVISGTVTLPSFTAKVRVAARAEGQGTTDVDLCNLQQAEAMPEPEPQVIGETNLVANPSLEDADPWDPAAPLHWNAEVWGALDGTADWAYDAADGARSGRVTVSNKTAGEEGDASWRSAPIAVTAGAKVRLRDRYKCTTLSRLRIYVENGDGSQKDWFSSGALPASPNAWADGELVAELPDWTRRIVVFHTLDDNGSLVVDAYDLRAATADPGGGGSGGGGGGGEPTPGDAVPTVAVIGDANIVPNPSVEAASVADPTWPYFWGGAAWGGAEATFTWQQEGTAGKRSVALGVTFPGAGEGGALWSTRMFPVKPRSTWASLTAKARGVGKAELWLVGRDVYEEPRWSYVGSYELDADWATIGGLVPVRGDAVALRVVLLMRSAGALQADEFVLVEADAPIGTGKSDGATELDSFDAGPKGGSLTTESGCSAGVSGGDGAAGSTVALVLLALLALGLRRGRIGGTLLLALLALAAPTPAQAAPLLQNGGVEGSGPADGAPAGWTRIVWGDAVQATLSWSQDGASGRTLTVVLDKAPASSDDGDAYWLSDAMPTPSGGAFRVSARYRSTAPCRLMVQALGGAAPTWRLVGRFDPSAEWATASGTVAIPDDASSIRVAFSLEAVGTLETDDYAVAAEAPPAEPWDGSPGGGLINAGFEAAAAAPALQHVEGKIPGWSFALNQGTGGGEIRDDGAPEGKRFARIEATSMASGGDATWRSGPVDVLPDGELMALRVRCRTSAPMQILLIEELAQGSARYRRIAMVRPIVGDEAAAAAFRDVGGTFALAADVARIRVAFAIGTVGVADLDDVRVGKADSFGPGTAQPRVSLAIDSPSGDVDAVLSALDARGIKASLYVPANRLGAAGATSVDRLLAAEAAGHEIGLYGEDVADWVNDNGEGWRGAVLRAYDRFREAGISAYGFAPPGGLVDGGAIDMIDGSEGYLRTLDSGLNLAPFDYLGVRVLDVNGALDGATFARWVVAAKRQEGWLVLRYGGQGSSGAIDVDRIGADLDTLAATGVEFRTVADVLGRETTPIEKVEPACSAAPVRGSASGRGAGFGLLAVVLAAGLLIQSRRKWQV